jgi:hypothetical protein
MAFNVFVFSFQDTCVCYIQAVQSNYMNMMEKTLHICKSSLLQISEYQSQNVQKWILYIFIRHTALLLKIIIEHLWRFNYN